MRFCKAVIAFSVFRAGRAYTSKAGTNSQVVLGHPNQHAHASRVKMFEASCVTSKRGMPEHISLSYTVAGREDGVFV